MKQTLEVEAKAWCPQCLAERKFTRQPRLANEGIIVYACEECHTKVLPAYLDNKVYQLIIRRDFKHGRLVE